MQPDIPALLRDSLFAPRAAAGRLLALRLPDGAGLALAALVAVLGALFVGVLSGGAATLPMGESEITVSPFLYAGALVVSLVLSAAAVHLAGRMLGGRGSYREALVVIAWVEFVALAVQVIQLVALLVLPPLAPILGLAGLVLLLWCLVNFVAVLHRFEGLGRPALTLVLGGLGLAVVVTLLIAALGGLGGMPDA